MVLPLTKPPEPATIIFFLLCVALFGLVRESSVETTFFIVNRWRGLDEVRDFRGDLRLNFRDVFECDKV